MNITCSFAGASGLSLGLAQAGWQVATVFDHDPASVENIPPEYWLLCLLVNTRVACESAPVYTEYLLLWTGTVITHAVVIVRADDGGYGLAACSSAVAVTAALGGTPGRSLADHLERSSHIWRNG
jgi:hypothetical protein